jgi:protein phosphatase
MILTSDGIHEYVELDDFEDLMADGSVSSEQKTASLVEMALENFSLDDKTVLIIERNGRQAGC